MEEEDAVAKSPKAAGAGCKKHASLHSSFLHLSRALAKLHGRRGHADDGKGEPPPSSSAASFLSGCMHPRTSSFASARRHHRHRHEREHDGDALGVNFRSSLRVGPASSGAGAGGSSSSAANHYDHSVGGSEGGPGAPQQAVVACGAGVAVVTFSAAPYEDFRRSMREMVDAATAAGSGGGAVAPAVDWDFMEELLFCYLHLNDRAVHKDILRAFTDTVAAIRWKSRRERRRKQQPSWERRDGHHVDADGEEETTSS
ncbi:hypothetical protein BS78_02G161000 [Paspalum vaginatum]|nr:hypothetical protein BS78_02G161000 [Paspalum vaginatum]KAJ1289395.1 hypothetical protein BS78_02G161000 [Paspalum vaginatum]